MMMQWYAGSSKRKRQEQHQPRKKQAVAQTAPVAEVTVQLPIQATEGSTASLDVTGVPDETDADMELGMQDKMAAAPAEAQTTAGSQQKSVAILADTQGATASKQVAQPQTDDQPAAMTGQSQNTQGVIPVTHTHQLISADAADGVVQQANQAKAKPSFEQLVLAKPLNDARGHTGYLTFARRSVDD